MLIFLKNNKSYYIYILFFILFVAGFNIYKDYGISIDEDNTRINGFVGLRYIYDTFGFKYDGILNNFPKINDFPEKGIGYIFDVPTAFIEYRFNIGDSRDYFLLRHLINFLYFFIGAIFFYLILKNRYKSTVLPFIGVLFFVLSPRIFAHSFFNNKDIIFLSLFLIATFFVIKTLKNPSLINSTSASLFIGLATGMRIFGIFLGIILFFFLVIKFLRNEKKKKTIRAILCVLISVPIFTVLFYPFLWSNPISNFLFIFDRLSNFDIDLYNFYSGMYIKAKNIPWDYSLLWIYATTPIIYLIFFTLGFTLMVIRIFFRLMNIQDKKIYNDLWRGDNEMIDLVFFSIIFFPIFFIIIINATLYGGLRHLFFIYPFVLIISIYGINLFRIKYLRRSANFFYIFIFLSMAPTVNWMIKNHPNQHVYFNIFFKKNFDKLFELDYWGVSINQHLNYINKTHKGNYKITNFGNMDLILNRNFLKKDKRSKMIITDDIFESDYVISNNIFWNGRILKNSYLLKNNFRKIHEVIVDEKTISSVYINKFKKNLPLK